MMERRASVAFPLWEPRPLPVRAVRIILHPSPDHALQSSPLLVYSTKTACRYKRLFGVLPVQVLS